MDVWLEPLITHSLAWSLTAVMLVAFLESLTFVGLILPGTVLMVSLGTLIGSGHLGFYSAWGAGLVGCLLGDWISYFIGWRFKHALHQWQFVQKYQALLDKTELALHRHSLLTVLVGRFVGPIRPLVPMAAGMLALPVRKFFPPSILGAILWPPAYLMPGILAGAAIEVPSQAQGSLFTWLLLAVALLVWLAIWLCWRAWRGVRTEDWASCWLTVTRLRWLAPLVLVGAAGSVAALQYHPMMPLFRQLLWRIFVAQ